MDTKTMAELAAIVCAKSEFPNARLHGGKLYAVNAPVREGDTRWPYQYLIIDTGADSPDANYCVNLKELKTGKNVLSCLGGVLNEGEYIDAPELGESLGTLPAGLFGSRLNVLARYAAKPGSNRQALETIYFDAMLKNVVATDGNALYLEKMDANTNLKDFFSLPVRALKAVNALPDVESVELYTTKRVEAGAHHLVFRGAGYQYIVELEDTPYPSYSEILPDEENCDRITLSAAELREWREALELLSKYPDGLNNIIVIKGNRWAASNAKTNSRVLVTQRAALAPEKLVAFNVRLLTRVLGDIAEGLHPDHPIALCYARSYKDVGFQNARVSCYLDGKGFGLPREKKVLLMPLRIDDVEAANALFSEIKEEADNDFLN